MNTNIYALLTPLALGFIVLEILVCWYYNKNHITFQEAVANFGTALGNQTMMCWWPLACISSTATCGIGTVLSIQLK